MKNDYLLIELSDKNELRGDASFKLLGKKYSNINVKIDTGCPYTSIPVRKIGMSEQLAQQCKLSDSNDKNVKKAISFGVNDDQKKRANDNLNFCAGDYMSINSVSFIHILENLEINGCKISDSIEIKVSYDRTGNILIGMDILKKMDIHIGFSKIYKKNVLIACMKDRINSQYLVALNEHFETGDNILSTQIN